MRVDLSASLTSLVAVPGLSLFFPASAQRSSISGLDVAGWFVDESEPASVNLNECVDRCVTLFPADGECECAYDVRRVGGGRLAAPAPSSHGPSSGGPRTIHLREERRLLRITAPESAAPGLHWGLGLDALRILESQRRTPQGEPAIDWLISIDAEEEEDILERVECGVQGESFRRDRGPSPLRIERVPCGPDAALVLPETCRVAAAMPGVFPPDAQLFWRVTPCTRQPSPLARCLDGQAQRPYWITCKSIPDARWLARSLPPGSAWAVQLSGEDHPLPDAQGLSDLQRDGCGGLALTRWDDRTLEVLAREGERGRGHALHT